MKRQHVLSNTMEKTWVHNAMGIWRQLKNGNLASTEKAIPDRSIHGTYRMSHPAVQGWPAHDPQASKRQALGGRMDLRAGMESSNAYASSNPRPAWLCKSDACGPQQYYVKTVSCSD